jgi:acyl-CoA hydrolase
MYVATEYGMVNLKCVSVAERALALILIANPDFHDSSSARREAKV